MVFNLWTHFSTEILTSGIVKFMAWQFGTFSSAGKEVSALSWGQVKLISSACTWSIFTHSLHAPIQKHPMSLSYLPPPPTPAVCFRHRQLWAGETSITLFLKLFPSHQKAMSSNPWHFHCGETNVLCLISHYFIYFCQVYFQCSRENNPSLSNLS